jgi:hypothetical protein
MNFSKLNPSDRRILIAAFVAVIGGLASIIDRWGFGGIVGGIAALGAVLVVLQPQLAPAMKLPAPKATLLLGLGAVAGLGFLVSALQYIGFVLDVTRIFTLLFDIGLVAAIALAYFTWLAYQAAAGKMGAPASATAAAPAPAAAAPADTGTMPDA